MIGNTSLAAMALAGSLSGMMFTVADGVYNRVSPPAIEGRGQVVGDPSPGQMVTVQWDIIKRVNCPGQSARVWAGENGFALAEGMQPTSLPSGPGRYTIPTTIPATAPPGDLTLTISGYFECQSQPRTYFSLTPIAMKVAAK